MDGEASSPPINLVFSFRFNQINYKPIKKKVCQLNYCELKHLFDFTFIEKYTNQSKQIQIEQRWHFKNLENE